MKNQRNKTQTISDREFEMLISQTCDKYDGALKKLANGSRRIASNKEIWRKFLELDKRYGGLYGDLAKI